MSVSVTRAILHDLSPADAAALWMIHHDSGGLAEAGLFEEWLGASEEHGIAWAALDHAWGLFDNADDPMFAELRQRALCATVEPSRRWRPWAIFGAVAGVLVAAAGGVLLMRGGGEPSAYLAGSDTLYKTGRVGRTVALADGSTIALAPDTQIRVGQRQVLFDRGKAIFSVRYDEDHPFKVTAGPWTVTDIGTRFEVGLDKSRMQVALYEGGVRLEDGRHAAIDLHPGQQFTASGQQPGEVSSIKAADAASSTDGMTEFDAVTLSQVVAQFNDANAIKLLIVDSKIATLHITGRFRLSDPARFANTIAQILPIKVVRAQDDRIELRARR